MSNKKVRTKKKTIASKKTKKKYVFANQSASKGKPLVVRFSENDPNPNHFSNRDLSWLDFNARVMHEALDKRTPLLERLRFMSIWRSNNDEFFMKRVGALFNKQLEGDYKLTHDGLSYRELYTLIRQKVEHQKKRISTCFEKEVSPALKEEGIIFMKWSELKKSEKDHLLTYFKKNIFPILTPLAVDSGHPFPFISNLSKSIGICLKRPKERTKQFARIKVPSEIPQWVRIQGHSSFEHRFINIEEIIQANLSLLFNGMTIVSHCLFRLTRNAAIDEEGDDAEDKMEWVEEGLKTRKFAPVVRIEILEESDPWILDFLINELDLAEENIYIMKTLPCYSNFSEILDINRKGLKYKSYSPRVPEVFDHKGNSDFSIFNMIRKQDALVHFPYESFNNSVESFVKTAASDPKVRAIKIILYRTDTDGRLIDALIEAAENKKQVACIIELKARFDEERNIQWAQKLEEAGIHVSYGLMDKKTHAKMILIVRQDNDALRTYVNIGTGNYNSQTSRLYTDHSFFTCNPDICDEVIEVFNYLTGRSNKEDYQHLLVAPYTMFKNFIRLIKEETKLAKKGKPARIIAKMNQLQEREIIEALYEASQAGVKITLHIRGFCTLKAQVKGLSENIQVFSIIGRLLEHSRIFYFGAGATRPEDGKFFIGSADWMHRNLFDRVEVIIPILQENHRIHLWEYLILSEADNRNLWELKGNGEYIQRKPKDKKSTVVSQIQLLKNKV